MLAPLPDGMEYMVPSVKPSGSAAVRVPVITTSSFPVATLSPEIVAGSLTSFIVSVTAFSALLPFASVATTVNK